MKIEFFEDLKIWQDARDLCRDIYKITETKPFRDDFRLSDQIRASSGSVMDNIAEGFEREGNKEFIQFLFISKSSCGECRSQLYRAYDFRYITEEELNEMIERTKSLSRKISGLILYLKKSTLSGTKYKPL